MAGVLTSSQPSTPGQRQVAVVFLRELVVSSREEEFLKLILWIWVGFSVFVFLPTYRDVNYSHHHPESGKITGKE